jgi:hypothetical protein
MDRKSARQCRAECDLSLCGPQRQSFCRWHNERLKMYDRSMSASSAKTDIIVRGLLPLLERAGSRLITMIAILCCAINAHSAGAQIQTCASEAPPSEQLGELFRNVQLKAYSRIAKPSLTCTLTSHLTQFLLIMRPARSNPALILAHSFINISRYRQRDQPFPPRRRANRLIRTLHGSGTS